MNNTIFISFPRSGRDLVQRWLHTYFKDRLSFIGDHNIIKRKKMPLTDDKLDEYNLIFSHDFRNVGINNRKTIMLFRHPIYSLISWWEYWEGIKSYEDLSKENQRKFKKFVRSRFQYWKAFFITAMSYINNPNILIIKYEDLLESPNETFASIVTFLSNETPDADRIKQIIEQHKNIGDPRRNKKKIVYNGSRNIDDSPLYAIQIKSFDSLHFQTDDLIKHFNYKIKPI